MWDEIDSSQWLAFRRVTDLIVDGYGTIDGWGTNWWSNSCRNSHSKCVNWWCAVYGGGPWFAVCGFVGAMCVVVGWWCKVCFIGPMEHEVTSCSASVYDEVDCSVPYPYM
ncbi:hypothetical protein IFM89_028265 [Coptis chinensis]|uniref:Transmembrane protein n=1 Tax=Coptis chinensis TaxID=261450 RepID=A0A835HGD9_9MAGN|nr:hypothetical protein IFM89_028265 [Coptis chinensis]